MILKNPGATRKSTGKYDFLDNEIASNYGISRKFNRNYFT
jgi:hypothetical protein